MEASVSGAWLMMVNQLRDAQQEIRGWRRLGAWLREAGAGEQCVVPCATQRDKALAQAYVATFRRRNGIEAKAQRAPFSVLVVRL